MLSSLSRHPPHAFSFHSLPCRTGFSSDGFPFRRLCGRSHRTRVGVSNLCQARVARSEVCIRVAGAKDLKGVTTVVTRVFCQDDAVMGMIEESAFGRLGMGGWMRRAYEWVCYWEVSTQLGKRLVEPEKGGVETREAFARRHVVLVAVDGTDRVVGCIEMGLVNVPRLLAEGVLNEVKQWEENVEKAGMEGGAAKLRKVESAEVMMREAHRMGKVTEGRTETMPYIGNLAVSSTYRRRGVGSELVREAQRHAMERWNRDEVCLHVEARNVGACLLYASLGFSCELQEPEWYGDIGRTRRLFLRGGVGRGKGREGDLKEVVNEWRGARVVGKRMNFIEYLRYCWYDLGRVRRKREEEGQGGPSR